LTRGGKLSPQEQAILDAWYKQLDHEEEALLSHAPSAASDSLRAEIDDVVSRLCTTTEQIKRLSAENEAVRAEIVALQHELARRRAVQPA
jgi:predicted  nucleic acid-binding Zn-ribbon protein